jgi:ABC-type nitrate/sulfonate/bicarbonate transport system ATPase subunit
MADLAGRDAGLVDARGVWRTFDEGRVDALRGVDLAVGAGEFVAVQGRSRSRRPAM